MTITTRVQSVSFRVADQDRALSFYTEVLGCEFVADFEALPGERLVIVTPPGADVTLLLLAKDSQIPNAVRLATPNAQEAFERLLQSGATLHNDEVLHLEGSPPMFHFADADGNSLVFMQESVPEMD